MNNIFEFLFIFLNALLVFTIRNCRFVNSNCRTKGRKNVSGVKKTILVIFGGRLGLFCTVENKRSDSVFIAEFFFPEKFDLKKN